MGILKRLSALSLASLLFASACSSHSGMGPLPSGEKRGTQSTSAAPVYVQSCDLGQTTKVTSLTVTCTNTPGIDHVLYALVYLDQTTTATITHPTGTWNLVETCKSTGHADMIGVYTHVVQSGETNSYAWSWGSTAYYARVNMLEYSGASTTAPVDSHACLTVAPGTAPQTVTSGTLSPTQMNEVPVFAVSQANTLTAPTAGTVSGGASGNCVRRDAGNSGGAAMADEDCPPITTNAATTATMVYSVVPGNGYLTEALLIAPPTQSAPVTMLAYAYATESGNGCGNGSQGLDPGATADQHLFWGLEGCGTETWSTKNANCPGHSAFSTCVSLQYIDIACTKAADSVDADVAWYNEANTTYESGFLHTWNSSISSANRQTSSCGGGSTTLTNLGDPNMLTWAGTGTNFWHNTSLFVTKGFFEDDAGPGLGYKGYGTNSVTNGPTEYGNSLPSLVGTGTNHESFSFLTGIAKFLNSAGAAGQFVVLNGIQGLGHNNGCTQIVSGHCWGSPGNGTTGFIDNQADFDDICSALTGPYFGGAIAERTVYSGSAFADPGNIAWFVNSAADLVASHTTDNCKDTAIVDLEAPGTGTNSTQIRLYTMALLWLIPSADGIPDRMIPWYYTAGSTNTEVSYWPEFTLVPSGAEHPLSRYKFNGATITNGSGCPSASGDTGGSLNILAGGSTAIGCNGSAPIYVQQYKHCYVNTVDKGACAAILNTGSSALTIQSSWFTGDAASTYHHEVGFSGYEMSSVPYSGLPTISLPCSNATYCNGSLNLTAAPFTADSTSIGASSGMLLIAQ